MLIPDSDKATRVCRSRWCCSSNTFNCLFFFIFCLALPKCLWTWSIPFPNYATKFLGVKTASRFSDSYFPHSCTVRIWMSIYIALPLCIYNLLLLFLIICRKDFRVLFKNSIGGSNWISYFFKNFHMNIGLFLFLDRINHIFILFIFGSNLWSVNKSNGSIEWPETR